MQEYDVVIGLEIHAELATKTKCFCNCKNEFGCEPNTNTCPVCTGMPGGLPILNKTAVEYCIKAGLCFGCDINDYAEFDRKNYFYPDLPTAYQISQLEYPLCLHGGVKLSNGRFIRLNRIHLEEDAGKLIHLGPDEGTLVDYNRGGTPLIEMVTEPDITSAEEAVELLKKMREALIFAGIANCKMEEGGMRCDVNISLKPAGSSEYGVRTEMKNINSFKSVARAIEYEISRQAKALRLGEKITQETRKWDDEKGKNFVMRTKEQATDYRYFPDPDIFPISISRDDVESIRKTMPMLPDERRVRYIEEFGLPEYDAEILTNSKYVSDYFENCVAAYNEPKKISNWIMVELLKIVKDQEEFVFPINEKDLTYIIKLVEEKKINKTTGVKLLNKVIESSKAPEVIVKEDNLLATISEDEILAILKDVYNNNPKVVEDYKANPNKVKGFIIGQVMRATGGKANNGVIVNLIPKVFD